MMGKCAWTDISNLLRIIKFTLQEIREKMGTQVTDRRLSCIMRNSFRCFQYPPLLKGIREGKRDSLETIRSTLPFAWI